MKFQKIFLSTVMFSTNLLSLPWFAGHAYAANQTASVTPLEPAGGLPYRMTLRKYDFGAATELPTLHSYAAAEHDGKWILVGGRTNGLHGFESSPTTNFPVAFQNRDIWVIDPVNKQSWRRSLEDTSAGLTANEFDSITSTNHQFYSRDSRLYMTGGYGARSTGGFGTFDTLTAIDLPGIVDWVVNGTGMAADHIRQNTGSNFQVTGGAMYEIDGRTHLVFGHNFEGGYRPGKVGVYTNQVRSFDIIDDGTTLSIQNESSTTPQDAYRRRDLNVFPVLRPDGSGGQEEGLVVLSGVFTESFGAWTVPVEIDATGQPSMADPNAPETFKQGFNGYHSAKLGLYSELTGSMNEVLFGGISLQTLDETTGQVVTDNAFPFVNDITSVVIDAQGTYRQYHLGNFPELFDLDNNRLRYGANAEFFLAEGIDTYENGVIKLDSLTDGDVLGYVFGGIVTNGPHTREGADSSGSNTIFEVIYNVPEPSGCILALLAGLALCTKATRRPSAANCRSFCIAAL